MGVIIRMWTSQGIQDVPMEKLLTQSQVDSLPEGTKVRIVWAGGNKGEYTIKKYYGLSYTTYVASDGKAYPGNLIDGVGEEKMHTKVWMVD